MNCPDFNILMMLLDGELEEWKLKEVSEHVKSCRRCRDLIDSQRELEASWREGFVIPGADKFRSMEWYIFNRINRRSRWKTFVPAAAGIIAVLLGVKLIMDNKPFPGRVTHLSRGDRGEYTDDSLQITEERIGSLTSTVDGTEFEIASDNATVIAPAESGLSTGDVTAEITSELEDYSVLDGEPEQPQPAAVEERVEESPTDMSSIAQETDQQTIVGGTGAGGGSRGSGGAGLCWDDIEEECEEVEITKEIMFLGTVAGSIGQEQVDEVDDITLSLDTDTSGLATVETVSSIASTSGEAEDNRAFAQSCEYHSRFNEEIYNDMYALKGDIFIEIVFDAEGQPDSCTALLLDSLFTGWSDYISFVYRDTVLVIPLADIRQLFMEGSTVPVETIE